MRLSLREFARLLGPLLAMALLVLPLDAHGYEDEDEPRPAKKTAPDKPFAEPEIPKDLQTTASTSRCQNFAISGGVEVASKYYQRGVTNLADNEGSALQPTFELELPCGFLFNYWGSNTSYPYARYLTNGAARRPPGSIPSESVETEQVPFAFENDLTLLWSLPVSEVGTLKLGGQYQYYMNATSNNVGEIWFIAEASPKIGDVELGDFALNAEYMLQNSDWTNPGDLYLWLSHKFPLAERWTLGWLLGAHAYGGKGSADPSMLLTTESFNFRHLDLSIERSTAAGLKLRATWTVGGFDRLGERMPSVLTWFAGFDFD